MTSFNTISRQILLLTCIMFLSIHLAIAQEENQDEITYQINRVQKYVSISPAQLKAAKTLTDLNHYYKADWVKEYKSVTTTVLSYGSKKVVSSESNTITKEQKELIRMADRNSDIKVIVTYLPDNNLTSTRAQEMDFSFRIDPAQDACYKGGDAQLDKYMEKHILNKITRDDVPQYQVAAINFTIDEEGHIVDAHIVKATNNKKADQLLLKTVCEMPAWESAKYADGTKTKQDFVLTVGDQYSCTMNILDIKSETPPSISKDQ